ncbi:MAG: hypothetical protein HPY52_15210 [Firmicutes bacterium]|nr:hypothetical protein [Bacillota bacterium]
MLDLVYKDIIQGRKLILMYLAMGAAMGLALSFAVTNVGSIIGMYMLVSAYGFAVRSTYDEDKNGSYIFLKGLPISDMTIVLGKFLSVFAASMIFALVFGVVGIIEQGIIASEFGPGTNEALLRDPGAFLREFLRTLAILYGLVLIISGVYLAMFFCLGYARATAYNRFIMISIAAFTAIGVAMIQKPHGAPPAWAVAFAAWIESLGQSSLLPLLVIGAGLIIYILCWAISVARVRTRDWS